MALLTLQSLSAAESSRAVLYCVDNTADVLPGRFNQQKPSTWC